MKKVILTTGGNRGIGFEICRQLADLGHIVYIGARDIVKGTEAATIIGNNSRPIQLDVADNDDIRRAVEKIATETGVLDVLINNAGIISTGVNAIDTETEEAQRVMETNYYGPWKTSGAFIQLLDKSKDGRIINMSSGMGSLADLVGGHGAYRLSKHALNGLTIQLANELSGKIKVNAMCPGWVRTDMGGEGAPRSVEEGADTAVWLATTDDIPTGKFFRNRSEISW